jgi:hypothetical protein
MSLAMKHGVARQRIVLHDRLQAPISRLAAACAGCWPHREGLEACLRDGLAVLPFCKYLYVLDADARQITGNVSPGGTLPEYCGRDRRHRPYLGRALSGERFSMSDAYISRNARRPSLTAIQRIEAQDGALLGYLGADFDLRELPLTRELCGQPEQWVQLKGDPSIRGGLFAQQRTESLMDGCIDDVLALMTELIAVHGVFHGKLHFSSSRATIWLADDPYRYRLLDFEDLSDPGICLAYTKRAYPQDAAIPAARVGEVFRGFRALRFMDDNIYLRSGSLNVMNGMVGLNFSCDGSHYMPWAELLEKSLTFWIGAGAACAEAGESAACREPETENGRPPNP